MKLLFLLSIIAIGFLSSCNGPSTVITSNESTLIYEKVERPDAQLGKYSYSINYDNFWDWRLLTDSNFKVGDRILFTTIKTYSALEVKANKFDSINKSLSDIPQLAMKVKLLSDSITKLNSELKGYRKAIQIITQKTKSE